MSTSRRKASKSSPIKFKRQQARAPESKHESNPTLNADVWLHRLSKLAQIATPILALLGFWYTVLPLYSKAILEEQVAQAQLELVSQTSELSILESSISAKQHEVEELMRHISIEEERSSALQEEISDLSRQRAAAEETAIQAAQDSKRLYEEMRASVLTAALSDADLCLVSVSDWSSFYTVYTRWVRDAEPRVMGDRYGGIGGIAQCIPNKVMNAYGVSRLSPHDTERLNAALAKHKPVLIADLQEIDDLLSDERDAFLSAEIVLGEYEQQIKEQAQRLSSKERMKQMKMKVQASVDFSSEHLEQIRSLGSDAMAALSAYNDSIRSDLIALQWIEQP